MVHTVTYHYDCQEYYRKPRPDENDGKRIPITANLPSNYLCSVNGRALPLFKGAFAIHSDGGYSIPCQVVTDPDYLPAPHAHGNRPYVKGFICHDCHLSAAWSREEPELWADFCGSKFNVPTVPGISVSKGQMFISEQEARYREYRIMRHRAECEGRKRSPAAKEFEEETKDHGVLECEMLVLILDGGMVPVDTACFIASEKRETVNLENMWGLIWTATEIELAAEALHAMFWKRPTPAEKVMQPVAPVIKAGGSVVDRSAVRDDVSLTEDNESVMHDGQSVMEDGLRPDSLTLELL